MGSGGSSPGALIVDLGEVDYVSSSGLKVPITSSRASTEMSRRMLAATPRPLVLELLDSSPRLKANVERR
jgi:anti-anti-sigma regulatory factor